jgi:hypothetical protein
VIYHDRGDGNATDKEMVSRLPMGAAYISTYCTRRVGGVELSSSTRDICDLRYYVRSDI